MNKAVLNVSLGRFRQLTAGNSIDYVVCPGKDDHIPVTELLFVGVDYDSVRDNLHVIVLHPSFPEYSDGMALIELQVKYRQ